MVISRNASRWSQLYRYRTDDTALKTRQCLRKERCEEMTGPAQAEERLSEVRFLTVAEVAALMRVSKMTVYRLVHGGELTAVRVGRSFRVPEHAVHEYLRGAFSQTA
jgi:excisionase family DNA binding protein